VTNDNTPPPSRLGFAVKVLGRPGLKSNDARRWQNNPHLSVSLGYLRDIFAYLADNDIWMYRMSSDLAPYATHPDLPQFHNQIRECAGELAEIGRLARARNLRLSFHPSQFVVLNSPDPVLVEKSVRDLVAQAEMLDAMELGPEAVVVIHVGGVYEDHRSARDRWVDTWHEILPEPVRRRLVLENDDIRFSAADVIDIHERTGVRLIFDYQHFWCNNPEGLDLGPTALRFLGSWPENGAAPKIHFSSPNTNMREVKRRNRQTNKPETAYLPPIWTGHADFLNPFEFITFLRAVGQARPFDVMLEAKAKDLALLRVRRDLVRYAPDLAPRFGIAADPPDARNEDVAEEIALAAAGEG
jgi:UV DNA damage endonuclease